tara:strand:+ start:490 stop:1059 length:570 start_codon:yes stop_codon:yes gene_type:complete
MFDAPIAGANYASDTKNYPWHRPPDIVSYDEGVDYMITKMNEPESLELIFSLLKIDAQVSTVVSSLLMQAISRGKYSIDLAILMAGPLARYIGIIADEQNIKYDMGVGDKDRIKITPTSLKMALGIIDGDEEAPTPEAVIEESTPMPEGGLMGAPSEDDMMTAASEDEQSAMLGLVEEVEEEETEDGLA